MRGRMIGAVLVLAACGKESTASTPPNVLVSSVLAVPNIANRWTVSVRNVGGDGTYRVSLRDAAGAARCRVVGGAINANATATSEYTCTGITTITVESQSGANPAWRATGCATTAGSACALLPPD